MDCIRTTGIYNFARNMCFDIPLSGLPSLHKLQYQKSLPKAYSIETYRDVPLLDS